MAFPQVASITETLFSTNDTGHLVSMPATVDADDLLVCLFGNDGTATVTTPTGWTLKSSDASAANRLGVYAKKAVGDEDGATVDFVTSAGENAWAQVYRITGWSATLSDVEVGVAATGTSATPDPPSLIPGGGAADHLWIAVECQDRGTDVGAVTFPTNYTDGVQSQTTFSGDACGGATARRELNASSEDPGTFGITSDDWVAQTVVVPPATAAGVTVTAAPAALTLTAQAASPTFAALVVDATPSALTLSAQAVTPVLAPVVVQASPTTLSLAAQAASPTLTALAVQAAPAALTVTAQVVSPVLAPVAVQATPAALDLVAQAASPTLSALVVSATPAVLELEAQAVSPLVAGAPIVITATPAPLSLTAQTVSPQLAPVVVTTTSAGLTVTPQTVTPIFGPLTVTATPAVLTLAASVVSPLAGDRPVIPALGSAAEPAAIGAVEDLTAGGLAGNLAAVGSALGPTGDK